jgi:hypothetical protein
MWLKLRWDNFINLWSISCWGDLPGERLRSGQVAAVILAGLGVVYLTVTFGLLPWISLVLALTLDYTD